MIKEYNNAQLRHVDCLTQLNKETCCNNGFVPGEYVKHHAHTASLGTVVSILPMGTSFICEVLWSIEPKLFIIPNVRRQVFAPLKGNKLVSVQPMTIPSSSVFFTNYQYNTSGSK